MISRISRTVALVLLMAVASQAFVNSSVKGARSSASAVQPVHQLHAAAKKAAAPKAKKAKKASKKAAAATTKKPTLEAFKKADFVAAVSEKTGLNKKDSEEAMQAVLEVIQEQVGNNKKVALAGFGTFTMKDRSARKGRNPQTGEEMQIKASKAPGFSVAKAWKEAINGKK